MATGKYFIPRARKFALVPIYWNGMSQTSEYVRKVHGICVPRFWQIKQPELLPAIYISEEWKRVGDFLLARTLREPHYIPGIYAAQHDAGKTQVRLSRAIIARDLASAPMEELFHLLGEIREAWLIHDGLNVLPWFVMGDGLSAHVYSELKRIHPALTAEDFQSLTTPPVKSFGACEELKVIELALRMRERGEEAILERNGSHEAFAELSIETQSGLQKLADEFYWVPFGYDGPETWDVEHYLRLIRSTLKQASNVLTAKRDDLQTYEKRIHQRHLELRSRLNIPDELLRLVAHLHVLTEMTDERKQFGFQSHVAFHHVLGEISRRLNIPLGLLKNVTEQEIERLHDDPSALLALCERRSRETFVIEHHQGKSSIHEGAEARRLEAELLPKIEGATELAGMVGSIGPRTKTLGKARILLTQNEIHRMNPGEILITAMTSPEYIPAMRKAIAIVTDEGGVTCHAAIVSRELGIPCVIATRSATRNIKDGDEIEVDTERGIVKVIKRA